MAHLEASFTDLEVLETIRMVETESLDIRAVTLGLSLRDCAARDVREVADRVYRKIVERAARLAPVCDELEAELGIPITNRRVAVTPIAFLADATGASDLTPIAQALDQAANECRIDFIGGFSALVEKGTTAGDRALLASIPAAISATERVCASVNVASSKAGINVDAIREMGRIVCELAERTRARDGIGCAKLVTFANVPYDNPFMAGAMHGPGEPDAAINVGVSGPGSVRAALEKAGDGLDLGAIAELVKRTAFKITRVGELAGREAARRLGVDFGIVDLSLAPTPEPHDSVADILELIGVGATGGPGTTLALALLTDAVKKGGAMAGSYVGGLSGAFIPVSEDAGMVRAVDRGALTLEKLEAMSSVCSVGLDMVVVPGATAPEDIAGIIADEVAIGVINKKTTAVRIIPAPGKVAGERVRYGGLLGEAPVMPVKPFSAAALIRRGGRVPPPITSLGN